MHARIGPLEVGYEQEDVLKRVTAYAFERLTKDLQVNCLYRGMSRLSIAKTTVVESDDQTFVLAKDWTKLNENLQKLPSIATKRESFLCLN